MQLFEIAQQQVNILVLKDFVLWTREDQTTMKSIGRLRTKCYSMIPFAVDWFDCLNPVVPVHCWMQLLSTFVHQSASFWKSREIDLQIFGEQPQCQRCKKTRRSDVVVEKE